MEFFEASLKTLKQQVFQSIVGYYWYLRLRGYEIDQVDFSRKSFGNTYALGKQTNDPKELARLLMKLCEKTGRLSTSPVSTHTFSFGIRGESVRSRCTPPGKFI